MRRGIFGAFKRDSVADDWLRGGNAWASTPSVTGMQINMSTAMKVTTVMDCVRILCEDTAKMPPYLYKEIAAGGKPDGGHEKVDPQDHPVAALLDRPNDWQTYAEFCSQMMVGYNLRGNGYAVILRDNGGHPKMLVPISPDYCRLWEAPGGELFWQVTKVGYHQMAVLKNQKWLIPYEDMFHLKGLSPNGLVGISPISYAAEAVALALGQEQQTARVMGNGARPSGILTTETKLNDETAKKLRDDWQQLNSGLMNSGKTAILEAGLKWQSVQLDSVDMQFIEQRIFQVQEICRIFRIPPHMVGDLSKGTFSNIVQQAQEYRNNTLMSISNAWEQRFNFTFGLRTEKLKVKLDESQLLRADITSRFNAHRVAILSGWQTINEVRAEEGLDAIEGADELIAPVNMTPLDKLGETPEPGAPGSDLTGKPADGAGKPSEDVNNKPVDQASKN